jgi:hypothetical protein
MNLIGTGWDVPIAQFSARVTLPEHAEVAQYNLTAGVSGSEEGEDFATIGRDGNVFEVVGLRSLNAYEGVTLKIDLLQGAFPDAKVWVPPLVVHHLDVQAVLDEYGVMTVREVYDMTVNDADSAMLYRYGQSGGAFSNSDAVSEEKYRFWIDTNGNRVDSVFAPIGAQENGRRIQLTLEYQKIHRITEGKKDYSIGVLMLDELGDTRVERVTMTVDTPFTIRSADAYIGWDKDATQAVQTTIQGSQLRASMERGIGSGSYSVLISFEDAMFLRRTHLGDIALPLIAALGFLAIGWMAFFRKKEKILTPPIQFYPPEGMNPAEAGYIIDGKVSGQDITSLIYYWASKGLLRLELAEEAKSYTLYKIREMDQGWPQYERTMYNAMWRHGQDGVVTSEQLNEKFYTAVWAASRGVVKSFGGMRSLESASLKRMAGLLVVALLVGVIALYNAVKLWWPFDSGMISFSVVAMLISGLIVNRVAAKMRAGRHKNGRASQGAAVIGMLCVGLLGVGVSVFALGGKGLLFVSALITSAALLLMFALLPFIRRRTEFGVYVLELTIGFKNFLQTAEKSRLERLFCFR